MQYIEQLNHKWSDEKIGCYLHSQLLDTSRIPQWFSYDRGVDLELCILHLERTDLP